jgi:hypothetical protein
VPTDRERILAFIHAFPGRDDDQVAAALRISPRQAVNQACRKLEARGLVRRAKTESGKIGNFPAGEPQVAEPDLEGETILADAGRPPLNLSQLVAAGFALSAYWELDVDGQLRAGAPLPKWPGVYAFVIGDRAHYVGLATMGLARRLHFYARPGSTQRTSQRLNKRLKQELGADRRVAIYTAAPDDLVWNGLPVNASAGLELGLIQSFHVPWNIRGAR